MMKRSERMEKIAAINTGYENIAGASLANAQSQHNKQLNQLDQLNIYKEEYQLKLKNRMSNSITSKEIQDYQFFFASLDDAISQQVEIVRRSANQVDLSREEWMDKKKEVEKIARVAEKLKQQEILADNKKEQNASDELTQLLFQIDKNKAPHH